LDVAYLQSLPENRDAVFQVASNFNAVEPISEEFNPSGVSFTERYYIDVTQGPIASISAGAAAIARVHAPFAENVKPVNEWSQTKTKQVNTLEGVSKHFPITNGYVTLTGEEPSFPPRHSMEYFQLLLKSSICYHKRCQVTSGHHNNRGLEKTQDPSQTVDQILCAGLNINQGLSGAINRRIPNVETKCRFVLDLAYHSTYISAIVNHRSHIFLTLVGGGAFGNKLDWIYDSIISAHQRWGKQNTSLRKVTLVLFKSSELLPRCLEIFKTAGIPYNNLHR
jgi:hypothetical protein